MDGAWGSVGDPAQRSDTTNSSDNDTPPSRFMPVRLSETYGVAVTADEVARRVQGLEQAIDYRFQRVSWAVQALSHRSFVNESPLSRQDNDRLEFLGDAALGFVISRFLVVEHPDLPAGELTKRRAALVCREAVAKAARRMGLSRLVLLGSGEASAGGKDRDSMLCDAMEAVLGAVLLDADESPGMASLAHRGPDCERGMAAVTTIVLRLWGLAPPPSVPATIDAGPALLPTDPPAPPITVNEASRDFAQEAIGNGMGEGRREAVISHRDEAPLGLAEGSFSDEGGGTSQSLLGSSSSSESVPPTSKALAHGALDHPPHDAKTALQEWLHRHGRRAAEYRRVGREGPDHAPTFHVELWIGGQSVERASAGTVKAAEREAAWRALLRLKAENGTAHAGSSSAAKPGNGKGRIPWRRRSFSHDGGNTGEG